MAETIVLATGGFDPIHSGHIEYFQSAKKLGDKLIVGVNSDEWLIKKKGNAFLPINERIEIVSNLLVVDETIEFEDDERNSASNAILKVVEKYPGHKIVFVNGGDRNEENIPEMNVYKDNPNIFFEFGVGGDFKKNSSSLILKNWHGLKEKRPWTVAADRGSTKGWMMLQMNRVYENEKAAGKLRPGAKKFTYEPIFDKFGDREIIVGFKDNTKAGGGKAYYGLDKYTKKGAGDWTKHGDWKLNQKLVDIAKRSGNAPNNVIMGLLKDRGFKNLDGKLKLNHLIHFLSGTEGTSSDVLKSAIARHHQSGVGFGSATDDLALTTRTINNKMKGIEKRIANNKILAADIQTLKNNNVYVRSPDGTLYGAGKTTPIGQFKQIESSVAKALETGVDFKGKKFDNKKMLKFFKDAGIPCIKGEGAQCNSIMDYQKGYNKLVQEAADGSKDAIQKLKGFTKAMRGITGVAKWTGYGLLAEAGFMVPFAIGDYAAGESWKRILGNATDYGFGPIFGQSEFEEFKAALPEGSKAVEAEKAIELGERLTGMAEQKVNPGYGRVGFEEKAPEQRQKVYTDILDEYEFNLQPFLSDTPFAKDQWHQGMWTQAHEEAAAARAQIEKEKQQRIDERIERGIIADRNWQSQVSYAGGGIVGIRRPHAIPPTGGPMSQGLRSLYINDRDY